MSRLVELLQAQDEAQRHLALDAAVQGLDAAALLRECAALHAFRAETPSLYAKVRALFFLQAIHRYHLAARPERLPARGARIPPDGVALLLDRRFEEAIAAFEAALVRDGAGDAICSALAAACRGLAFQTLADQVRRSVRGERGNQWMFRCGHPLDQPLRFRRELLARAPDGSSPWLRERTPVRMDLTHCGWSDIFFLGMDHPEGARVLNISIDLGVHGRDAAPEPPVEAWLRVIDRPVFRLESRDLGAAAEISELAPLFDFARDHLGLLKAALLAAGVVPPGIEGSGTTLRELLARLVGEGRGLELVSIVRGIPKGSRLAVSTTLLGSLISLLMRATGQAAALTGALSEGERRTCAARAILGEWLGGSGGGWQDSGGLWPGIKLIEGVAAAAGDPEWGVSRGRLMPRHTLLGRDRVPEAAHARLAQSLVLVHGGMAQNVGPILEMVTEKYLLRSAREWQARQETGAILEELLQALAAGDMRRLAAATTRNFFGPLTTIIPQASNAFTESVIARTRVRFGAEWLGFWMLGGMSGGGMGFIFEPAGAGDSAAVVAERLAARKRAMQEILSAAKGELEAALPFAMEPVVYDFAINERGTWAEWAEGEAAPEHTRRASAEAAAGSSAGAAAAGAAAVAGSAATADDGPRPPALAALLGSLGFDATEHEAIRADLRAGRIGLAQSRLPVHTQVRDVEPGDVLDLRSGATAAAIARGEAALARGEVAVVTLAAGAGSRWSGGAGVVKALFPFARFDGQFRSFLDVHLAKSRRAARAAGCPIPHLITTSHFTHAALARALRPQKRRSDDSTETSPERELLVALSPGRSVGLRLVPMERDLRFLWEESSHQRLDRQQQKLRESAHAALIGWARAAGEGSDYVDNVPLQCLHPVGHFYELPNLLKNGVLGGLLRQRPQLRTLLLHNVDTLGADLDAGLLGTHLAQVDQGATLTFEVIRRQLEDRGGGLARVDGRLRLIEGLALPREEQELELSWYNSMTTWIDLDRLLERFGLTREQVLQASADPTSAAAAAIAAAVRRIAAQLPTYVTLKDVKKRWGHAQEDVFPVTQFEKLWSDVTALPDLIARYVAVPRVRGQQLKEIAQLDPWLRDGSAEAIAARCAW
ncbi:MAG: UTP--glucose-1-phosphate uridylyltransferase [Planctomycetes bacterium]|nr:UTP--glucose-1-phosphate uridylyltransferase [Planctomycetota bacterium]